ncbi:hypothetical protein HNY73_008120 [Argiope bruennichi]|uniref:Uncharacterized protein n=1 Tax=Argiope bruennichi TaxID=94029 RepID=A0A8T0FAD2_ARGBR|nr:hypothetical protein HNY73_008120 [Argiope bruennichi]
MTITSVQASKFKTVKNASIRSLGKLSSSTNELKKFPRNLLFDTRLMTEGNKFKVSFLDCPSTLHEER